VEGASARVIDFCIYAFHMPLFIFAAGYFSKRVLRTGEFPAQKAFGYFLLVLAIKALKCLLYWAMGARYAFHPFTSADAPWYLTAMILWLVFARALHARPLKPAFALPAMVLLALLIGYDSSVGNVLALSRAIVFLPFFYAGLVLPSHWMERMRAKRWRWLALGVFAAAVAVIAWQREFFLPLRPMLTGHRPYGKVATIDWAWGPAYRLWHYALACVLGLAFLLIAPKRRVPLLSALGARTLQVYFWQSVLMPLFVLKRSGQPSLFAQLSGAVPLPVFILIIAAFTLLLGLKPFGYPVRWLLEPKAPRWIFKETKESVSL
jgi:fucose 4-O-acetylase-like acetyltransferase